MSLAKKLIAGSALILAAGCTRTIFDGSSLHLEENTSARLTVTQSFFGNYTMTLSEVYSNLQNLNGQCGSCTYLIKARPDSKITSARKRCEGAVKIENPQKIFNKYMDFIEEPVKQ